MERLTTCQNIACRKLLPGKAPECTATTFRRLYVLPVRGAWGSLLVFLVGHLPPIASAFEAGERSVQTDLTLGLREP